MRWPSSIRRRTARNTKTADRHVAFQDTEAPQQAMIHPLFRQRLGSGRAGNVGALDDRIARYGGTTSSYEELPHRLKISKKHQPMTLPERVMELTKTNDFLLQELAYHKDTRAAEMRFWRKTPSSVPRWKAPWQSSIVPWRRGRRPEQMRNRFC